MLQQIPLLFSYHSFTFRSRYFTLTSRDLIDIIPALKKAKQRVNSLHQTNTI